MENINLVSEYYLSTCFLIYFVSGTFLFLSKNKGIPNYYNGLCYLLIISFVNSILIDFWNRLSNIISFDLHKNIGDIYIKLFILSAVIIYVIYSSDYVKKMSLNNFEFLVIIFLVTISFCYFFIVIDFISFYLLLEIQSLGFYILTAFSNKNQYSVESSLKYFILSSFASVILLFGYSLIYGITGIFNFSDMQYLSTYINNNNQTIISYVYILGIIFMLLAFLLKLYAAPFHIWISDIYQGAPTMSTAFFGTITSMPLFYIFCKYYIFFLSFIEYYIFYIILCVVVLSIFFGSIGALYQKKIKRLIAFSSVSNIGYVLIGFLEENPLILSNSFSYFIIYIINSIGIFLIFLNLYLKKYKFFIERFSLLSNFIQKNILLSLCLIIILFSVSGMPPFSLFVVKILLFTGVSNEIYSILIYLTVITSILGSFYYLRIIKIITFNKIKSYNHICTLNYVNALMLLLIVLYQFFFIFYYNYLTIFSDIVVLFLYNLF